MEHVLKFRVKLLPGEQPTKEVIKKYREQISNVLSFLEKKDKEQFVYPSLEEKDSILFRYRVDID